MASNNETASVKLEVNGEQAVKELDRLRKKSEALTKELNKALARGDRSGAKQLSDQLRRVDKEIQNMQSSAANLDKVMRNLSGASVKELNAALRKLQKDMNNGSIERGSKEWQTYAENIRRVKEELNNVREQTNIVKKEQFSLGTIFEGITGAWAGLDLLSQFKDTVTEFVGSMRKIRNERDNAKHMMQAITGLDPETINEYEADAQRMATTMLDGGLRIKASATEILSAFQSVIAANGELANDKEGTLSATTEAFRLAAASGEDFTVTVDALMSALNEYGESASKAAEYANVMAAGSQVGAAEIGDIASSLKRAGVAAASSNIPITELVGSLELLAEKGIKDEVAGTGLKSFFLTLATGADDTNPKVVGLSKALENLRNKQLTDADFKKMFGKSGYNVARIMVDGKESFDKYTQAVVGTNAAIEQAAINSETYEAKSAQLANTMDDVYIKMYEELSPALAQFYTGMNSLIRILPDVISFIKTYGVTILSIIAPIVAYNAAIAISNSRLVLNIISLKNYISSISLAAVRTNVFRVAKLAAAAATNLFAGNLTKATKAFKAMTMAMKANPIGLIVSLLTAAALAAYKFLSAQKELTVQEQASLAVKERLAKAEAEDPNRKELDSLKELHKVVLDNNALYSERVNAINKMKQLMPGYTAELSKEGKILGENSQLFKDYVAYLENEAKWKAASQGVTETADDIEKKKAELETLLAQQKANRDAILADKKKADTVTVNGIEYEVTGIQKGMSNLWYGLRLWWTDNKDDIEETSSAIELLEAQLQAFKDAEEKARLAAVDLNKEVIAGLGNNASAMEQSTGKILSDDEIKAAIKNLELFYKKKRLAVERDYQSGKLLNLKDKNEQLSMEDTLFRRKAYLELNLLNAKQHYYRKDSEEYVDFELKKLEIKRSIEQQKWQLEESRRKVEMSFEYMTGGISYEELQKREIELEEESFQNRLKVVSAGTAEHKQILTEYYKWKTDQQTKSAAKDAKQIEKDLELEKNSIGLLFARGDINETSYSEAIFRAEYDSMQQKLKLYNEGSKEYVEIEEKMQALALENRQKREKAEAEYVKKFREQYDFEYMIKEAQQKVAEMKSALMKQGYTSAEASQMTDKASSDTADSVISGSSKSINPVEKYRSQIAAIASLESQGVISHEDAERRKLLATTETLETMEEMYSQAYNSIAQIMGAVSDYQDAKMSYETAKVEKEYDKRIEAAGRNKRQVEKLEKEKEQKVAAIKTTANEKAMKMEIAQAIAQTAMGALSAYTSTLKGAPYPANLILAPISAGIALAAGTMQVATIKKQHQAESMGYSGGGFTPSGAWDEPQGVVHSNEFVANRFAVGNKNIAPALRLIDSAQRNNTVGSLTADDVTSVLGGGRRETASAAQTVATVQSAVAMKATATAMNALDGSLSRLNEQLNKGIHAYTTITGPNGSEEQNRKYNQLKNNAR